MKKKIFAVLIAAFLLLSIFSLVYVPTVTSAGHPYYEVSKPKPPKSTHSPLVLDDDPMAIDGTPHLETVTIEGVEPDTGNTWTVPVSDDYYGGMYRQDFVCVLSGVHANIWIGLNDTVWTGGYHDEFVDNPGFENDVWYFAYPWSYTGYSLMPAGYRDSITGKNLTYVLGQFDNNIWQKDTAFFGMYKDRPGPLNDYKIQILIFNMRDGLFWDPVHAPWFIEGYYWYYASNLNNANIIHIDTYQWWRRLGPNPKPLYGYGKLPYEYEGTFAHEFQHLIHRDIDFDEMSWVNEGCSGLAQYICGYGFPSGHIMQYLAYWWDTSLVIWQGELSNYGATFLWAFYMYEHYGGQPFIWAVVHEQANGIAGYNNVLNAFNIKKDFDNIFQDWSIANYLDDTSFAKGIYGYYALNIPSAATRGWSLPYSIWYWEYWYPTLFDTQVTEYPNVGYNYPYGWSLPYVVNYVEFYDASPELKVYFDGDDYCGVPAYSGMYEWYSDGTAYSWFRLGQTFNIPATGATLKFWTYYEIEENWDYGYVEVHDLDTDEWYTLPGLTTISTIPNPQDNLNCPDDVEPTTYLAAGRWNAFTGFAGDWYQEEMNLSPFAGHTIKLYFTYWTDPYTLELGWYIDDIEIQEIGFFDDVESGANGWTVNAGWYITTGIIPNDFEVNFIQTLNIMIKGEEFTIYHISPVQLNDETEEGWQLLKAIVTRTVQTGPAVMVVANQPGYEHTFGTFYYFIADIQPFLGPH